MSRPDFIVIGAGIGGLVCAGILVREGYRVSVLEKNRQLGGCLQVFSRDKVLFDSGVHYLGALDKGQSLYQIFEYLGIMQALKVVRLDEVFDRVLLENDPREYPLAQGFAAHRANLVHHFPQEADAIDRYLAAIKDTCEHFPLYRLETREIPGKPKSAVTGIPARGFIESLTSDRKLQAVLAGNNMLYEGAGEATPFYVHALTVNSYIESAWRCAAGGGQISRLLAGRIRAAGSEVFGHAAVKTIRRRAGLAESVLLTDGREFFADRFISNLPPVQTYRLLETPVLRQAARLRMEARPNTVSSFILNLVFHPRRIPYVAHNYYYHREGQVWHLAEYDPAHWPAGYGLYLTPSRHPDGFAQGMTIFAFMRYEEVIPWAGTVNTVDHPQDRGPGYAAFKARKAEQLLDCVETRFPGLRSAIRSSSSSTPLSYRDYLGNDDGNCYGARKDYRDPVAATLSPRTKVPNLFLTGQSLNLHGILGTAISGLITAGEIIGNMDFVEKIRHA